MTRHAIEEPGGGYRTKRHREKRYGGLVKRVGPLGKIGIELTSIASSTRLVKAKQALSRDSIMFETAVFRQPIGLISIVGVVMEDATELLEAANKEVENSRLILEDLQNKVRALGDIVLPALAEQVKAIRDSRMAVSREVGQILGDLRDVRQFFIEKDYELEMARLERFIALCKELQGLKSDGTLDAVLDSALHLATGERE
jgi:hypothetical protein